MLDTFHSDFVAHANRLFQDLPEDENEFLEFRELMELQDDLQTKVVSIPCTDYQPIDILV